jgi:hypothetical protein
MIRRRLTAVIVALVAVVGLLAAVGVIRALESRLVADIDEDLERVPDELTRPVAEALQRRLDPVAFDVRRVAFVRLGPQGTLVDSISSGPSDAPEPLPDVAAVPPDADGPVTVP